MTIKDVPDWAIEEFENGYHPGDEPPGFEELFYKLWVESGGTVKAKPPVTMDDL